MQVKRVLNHTRIKIRCNLTEILEGNELNEQKQETEDFKAMHLEIKPFDDYIELCHLSFWASENTQFHVKYNQVVDKTNTIAFFFLINKRTSSKFHFIINWMWTRCSSCFTFLWTFWLRLILLCALLNLSESMRLKPFVFVKKTNMYRKICSKNWDQEWQTQKRFIKNCSCPFRPEHCRASVARLIWTKSRQNIFV